MFSYIFKKWNFLALILKIFLYFLKRKLFLYFGKMKLLKFFLYFRKRNFLIFQEVTFHAQKMKKLLIFWEKELSSSQLKNLLIFQEKTCKSLKKNLHFLLVVRELSKYKHTQKSFLDFPL